MDDVIAFTVFAQYVISRVLAAYIMNHSGFADSVNEVVDDVWNVSVGDEKMSGIELLMFRLDLASMDLARQLAESYLEKSDG